jgi:hypothetical protein
MSLHFFLFEENSNESSNIIEEVKKNLKILFIEEDQRASKKKMIK